MTVLPGDPAPRFTARASNNPRFVFDTAAGRHLVLTFVPSGADPAARELLVRLAVADAFDDELASLFIVTADPADEADGRLPLRLPGVRAFHDPDGAVARLYGVECPSGRPVSVLISPRLQVVGVIAGEDADAAAHAARVVGHLARAPAPAALPDGLGHAPVLVIPFILEPGLCRVLIEGYERHGGVASGFMREVGGRTVQVSDERHKVRRDWDVGDERLVAAIRARFVRRVAPEIRKAFQFEVTRMERHIVACYDAAEGGHFRPHRDNTTRGTAHRRFAVSVNLNADGYEGGDLRFPEFGAATYRAPTGGGVVFSCSLLHEATRVTRGRRYAFLPFLYDEAAARLREENNRHLGEGVGAYRREGAAARAGTEGTAGGAEEASDVGRPSVGR